MVYLHCWGGIGRTGTIVGCWLARNGFPGKAALCLAESLIECRGFDPADQMKRNVRWWQEGYLSSTGTCFDIGNTIRAALSAFIETGNPFSGPTDFYSSGNGSLMRLAPVPLFFAGDPRRAIEKSGESSRTTLMRPPRHRRLPVFCSLDCRSTQQRRQGNPPVRSLFSHSRLLAGTPPFSGNRRNRRRILQTEKPAGHPWNGLCRPVPGGRPLGLPSRRIFLRNA